MRTPEQIQYEIEQTRQALSDDVNALGDKVSPSQIVHRRIDRVKDSATSVKERVMGSPNGGGAQSLVQSANDRAAEAKDEVASTASEVGDRLSSAAAHAGDAVSAAPQMVRQQTQGNPLAAGLIAFGVGWLAASLVPSSRKEQEFGEQVRDQAQQLAQPVAEKASEMADELREPARQAAHEVADTAKQAARETAQEARDSAEQVKEPLTT